MNVRRKITKHGFGENITEPLKIDLDSSVEDIEAKADALEQAKDKNQNSSTG